MYAEVVVLTYQAPDINSFTYEVPKALQSRIAIGQLVEVPFGKRNPMGIIVNLSRVRPLGGSDPVHIKPVTKILLNQPLLLPYQIELAKWMADYYIAPLVNCLETMLPEIPKKIIQGATLNRVGPSNDRPSPVNQSLILVPSINRIAETLAKFPKAKNYVVYHGELKPAEKFTAWNKIISGSADYIFGSRSAIFTPCPNLKEIVIYDEHENGYKDERSPYFDTLTVAEKLAKLTGAQLKIVDPAPKITTYSALQNHIKIQKFNTKSQIVSMKNERLSGNRSSISFPLEEQIMENYEAENNILLFLNRKKESGFLFCKNCKNSQFLDIQPSSCPICKSADFFFNTLNINSLATNIKKIIPNVKINLISNNELLTMNHEQFMIDIATASIFYWPLPKKYSLIAYIQTDSLLNLPDFSARETLYSQITNLKKMLKNNGKLVLQTTDAENEFLNAAAGDDFEKYYQLQLTGRKSLNYPPFGLLVKLTLKGKNVDKIKKEAEKTVADLKSSMNHELSTINHQLTILGPYQSIYRGTKYNIILKYKLKNYTLENRENSVSEISELLKNLRNWQITVEPESIN